MKKKILWLLFLMFPFIVFAKEEAPVEMGMIIFMELFVSIHMSLFVLMPLSKIFSELESKKLFWQLFTIRACILLFFDFFVTPYIAFVDFLAVFAGAFIVVPICAAIKKKTFFGDSKVNVLSSTIDNEGVTMKCKSCGKELALTDKFCQYCGSKVSNETVNVTYSKDPKKIVEYSSFDNMFKQSEDQMVESFINKELSKASYGMNNKKIPSALLKRKNNLNFIFSILLFIYIVMIFFHFPLLTYLVGIIILIIFKKSTSSLDVKKYIIKEVKSRPSEKVSNIVMSIKGSLVEDDKKSFRLIVNIVAIVVALILFINPHIIYEKVDDGYSMRYYTFGLTNFTSVEIPEEYKGKPVVSLRGNAFSNMFFLKKVKLPDTITEIRGQAFKNCYFLKEVNIPSKLESIGGASFYNCRSIENVEFPDTVVEFGGEMFKNASSLKSVKLSNNITEIRGNSFENCAYLESIDIPDKVTRIGGHAFYGNSRLKSVKISSNSELEEIGSSAFRLCPLLANITIPSDTYVNERAFRDSPTQIFRYDEDGNVKEDINSLRSLYFNNIDSTSYVYLPEYRDSIVISYDDYSMTPSYKEYKFSISGVIEDEFVVSSDNLEYRVNDNIVIYLDIDSCYNESVTLKISY